MRSYNKFISMLIMWHITIFGMGSNNLLNKTRRSHSTPSSPTTTQHRNTRIPNLDIIKQNYPAYTMSIGANTEHSLLNHLQKNNIQTITCITSNKQSTEYCLDVLRALFIIPYSLQAKNHRTAIIHMAGLEQLVEANFLERHGYSEISPQELIKKHTANEEKIIKLTSANNHLKKQLYYFKSLLAIGVLFCGIYHYSALKNYSVKAFSSIFKYCKNDTLTYTEIK